MKYLLDTCVISELVKQRPSTLVVEWLRQQDPDSLYLSSVTVGEIKKESTNAVATHGHSS